MFMSSVNNVNSPCGFVASHFLLMYNNMHSNFDKCTNIIVHMTKEIVFLVVLNQSRADVLIGVALLPQVSKQEEFDTAKNENSKMHGKDCMTFYIFIKHCCHFYESILPL